MRNGAPLPTAHKGNVVHLDTEGLATPSETPLSVGCKDALRILPSIPKTAPCWLFGNGASLTFSPHHPAEFRYQGAARSLV